MCGWPFRHIDVGPVLVGMAVLPPPASSARMRMGCVYVYAVCLWCGDGARQSLFAFRAPFAVESTSFPLTPLLALFVPLRLSLIYCVCLLCLYVCMWICIVFMMHGCACVVVRAGDLSMLYTVFHQVLHVEPPVALFSRLLTEAGCARPGLRALYDAVLAHKESGIVGGVYMCTAARDTTGWVSFLKATLEHWYGRRIYDGVIEGACPPTCALCVCA